jgi:shikimate kinase
VDLVLVGLPGSGKSAVGRRLASRHHATFVDLDELVERAVGKSVPAIFADEGEAGFRRHEREAVLSLGPADQDPKLRRVISTGGGTVIDPRNRWLLYRGRFPVWLDGAPEVLASRLGNSANVRPLVAGRDPLTTLQALAESRRRFYAPGLRVSGLARVDDIMRAVEGGMGDGPSQAVTVLRADTAIGHVEIGCGIAARAVSAALTRGAATRAILLS